MYHSNNVKVEECLDQSSYSFPVQPVHVFGVSSKILNSMSVDVVCASLESISLEDERRSSTRGM